VFVEVGFEIDGVLVDVAHHFERDLGQARLGVTVGSRGVTVAGTKVAVAVDEHVAHREILGHADHGVVDGGVTMGVETAEDVTDGGGALAVGFVRGEALGEHRVEDAAMDGFQAVTDIRQGTVGNNTHRIVDE